MPEGAKVNVKNLNFFVKNEMLRCSQHDNAILTISFLLQK